MRPPRILPYSRQCIGEDDVRAVSRALRRDWITQGPAVEAFEREFAEFVGARHAVAVSSGTAALHAAYHAAGIGPGDEVVVPPITFTATANAAVYLGARPRFADVDPETALMDPATAEKALTARTRAVVPVDFAGHPADLGGFRRLADRRKLVLIEDAAHALGAEYRGRRVGAAADLTVFSFHPVKHITTGEGGMVTTENAEYARRMREFRHHGITKDPSRMGRYEGPWYYEMHELGYNYRITDIQCALGSSQLRKAAAFVRARRAAAAEYGRGFAGVEELGLPVEREWARHAYHLYPIRLRLERLKGGRGAVFEALRRRGLGVQVHYIPVHLQPYYRKRYGTRAGAHPGAEAFYASEISLPVYPQLTGAEVRRVIRDVKAVLRRFRRGGQERA